MTLKFTIKIQAQHVHKKNKFDLLTNPFKKKYGKGLVEISKSFEMAKDLNQFHRDFEMKGYKEFTLLNQYF